MSEHQNLEGKKQAIIVSQVGVSDRAGQSRNRHRVSVTTREKVTWLASDNILELHLLVLTTTAQANDKTDTCVGFVFNAPDDATADAWLNENSDGEADDVQFVLVPVGVPTTVRFMQGTNPITRCDFKKMDGTPTCRVYIGAI